MCHPWWILQQYKLHPSAQDLQEGIWQYHPQADGGHWNYVIRDGITYAVNELFIDWDDNDMSVWNPNDMGQWPFGNQLSEDEGYNTSPEVDFELFDYWALGLNSHLWRINLYKDNEDGFWTL